jgi:(1->4)-alpha-D-glucan 1-alpha-D-glucosylmutase
MLTTSTHDSKRGEDAGARLAVLSELPAEWQRAVVRWSRIADQRRSLVDGRRAPSRRDEYTLYQSLVGAWPFGWDGRADRQPFAERVAAFMEKALKEAKQETSWTRPNPDYERATRELVMGLLGDDSFVEDVAAFCAGIETYGATNGLALTLLRLTSPGVPDTYQGAELWNQSFVDPDNRRPVDFARRREVLARVRAGLAERLALCRQLLAGFADGAVKLYVIHTVLGVRARFRDVFLRGDYEPILGGEHVVAFARANGGGRLVVVAPRLVFRLTRGARPWPIGQVWGEQTLNLPPGSYRDAFTGAVHTAAEEPVALAGLLADFPLALLVPEG